MGFIDKMVNTILKPVLDKVEAWLKNLFKLPEFPDFSMVSHAPKGKRDSYALRATCS